MQKYIKGQKGQVLSEYVIMLVMLAAVAFALFVLMAVLTEYGWRFTSLLGWEYGA